MQNNKLFNILSYLDKSEIVRCRKYIHSPYYNNSDSLAELFEQFLSLLEKDSDKLPKEKIWKKLYGSEDYDDVRFRKLCSDLLKLVEGFLAQQIYEENPIRQATHLIEAVARKRMAKLYNTAMKTARRLSERQHLMPANHYYYEYQIEKNYFDILSHTEKRQQKTNVENIVNNLDRFYLAEKLKYYCSVLSYQYQVSHEYKLLFIDEIINHINTYDYSDVPSIDIYYKVYLTQTNTQDIEHYHALKIALEKNAALFPKNEAYELYTYALNYCARKVNLAQSQFLREYLETFQDLLSKNIIDFSDEEHGPWHFKNVISMAVRMGDYVWTENFINNYKDQLPDVSKDNAVSFNMAQLYFYKKDWGKVIKYLHQVEYEDMTYNLNSKIILLCTYFELDEIEPMYSLMEAFRVYLQRNNKLPAQRRRNYLNYIRFLKKLAKLMPNDEKQKADFLLELEETPGVVSKEWLKNKVKEI